MKWVAVEEDQDFSPSSASALPKGKRGPEALLPGHSAEMLAALRGAKDEVDVFPLPLPPVPVWRSKGSRRNAARIRLKWDTYMWVREIVEVLNSDWGGSELPYVMRGPE